MPISEARLELIREVGDAKVLLDALGIDIARDDGSEIYALCPYHDDRNPSWSIHTENGERWGVHSCWSCRESFGGGKGTAFDLVMHMRGCSFRNAVRWCEELFGVSGDSDEALDFSLRSRVRELRSHNRSAPAKTVARQFERFPSLKENSAGWRYLVRRGVTRSQILETRVRRGDGTYRKRVVFPIFKGLTVVNFYARHISGGEPKGLNATGKGLVSESLFNYQRIDPMVDHCYLSESVFDALAIERCGAANSLGTGGAQLLKGQVDLLRRFRKVIVVPDMKGGAASLVPSCKALLSDKRLETVILPRGEDPDSYWLKNQSDMEDRVSHPSSLRRSKVIYVVDYSLPRNT